jgi:hypothetical protein
MALMPAITIMMQPAGLTFMVLRLLKSFCLEESQRLGDVVDAPSRYLLAGIAEKMSSSPYALVAASDEL